MTRRSLAILLPGLFVLSAAGPAPAEPAALVSTAAGREDLAVTVYNQNLGLVKDTRRVALGRGQLPLRFADVAAQIDPTSVGFRSLSDGDGVDVLEQNYEYDLITPAKLMEKYVGRELEIRMPGDQHEAARTVRATLISTNEGYVYRIGNRVYLQPPGEVILPDLPGDLVAQPSLVWQLDVKRGGSQKVEASYMTSGMSWQADYVVVSAQDNRKADLTGWVTLKNQSGASFPDARLTLVAGDVHRAGPLPPTVVVERSMAAEAPAGKAQFTPQNLFEYHSYDLNRRTTLKQNETKQLTLFTASGVPTRKVYVFDGSRTQWLRGRAQAKVQVMLEFDNTQKSALGMPLPAGRVRVYQEDAAKKLQFIGEDAIDHTPRDEKVRVEMGNAFDVVGERKQMSEREISAFVHEYAYQITLRNHKDQDIDLTVLEHQYGDWEVVQKSHRFEKTSATELEFPVRVPANGETKVTYSVRIFG